MEGAPPSEACTAHLLREGESSRERFNEDYRVRGTLQASVYTMNPAVLSTLAALGGSSIGALGPIVSNYVLQRGQTQRDLLLRQIADREALYSDFINEASRIYVHSQIHSLERPEDLVPLHALVRRIRLLASDTVVNAAESVVKQTITQYDGPNRTVEQIRADAVSGVEGPLDLFSFACRDELQSIVLRGALSAMHRR